MFLQNKIYYKKAHQIFYLYIKFYIYLNYLFKFKLLNKNDSMLPI